MASYRKRPAMIEATQFHAEGDHPAVLLVFIRDDNGAVLGTDIPFDSKLEYHVGFGIKTLEGWHQVTFGDWIVTGVMGEVYPIKDSIFRETYELVMVQANEK